MRVISDYIGRLNITKNAYQWIGHRSISIYITWKQSFSKLFILTSKYPPISICDLLIVSALSLTNTYYFFMQWPFLTIWEREMNFLYTHIRKRVIHHYYAEYIACQCMPSHRPGSHMAINLCTYTLPLQINLLFSALAYNHVTFTDCWQGISDGYK